MFFKEAKRNFATHSDFSVEIKDEVDRLKVLRDIWTLIGYMIEIYRILHHLSVKSMLKKFKLKPVPVIFSNSQNFDQAIMFFLWITILYPKVLNFYAVKDAKMNNIGCPTETSLIKIGRQKTLPMKREKT